MQAPERGLAAVNGRSEPEPQVGAGPGTGAGGGAGTGAGAGPGTGAGAGAGTGAGAGAGTGAGALASDLVELAAAAAERAGSLLRQRFEAGPERSVTTKSTATDLVSEADFAAQRAIRSLLDERRPGDGFLGEEGGDAAGSTGLRWVVDPLDGTVNYLFGIPQWCVSIAVRDDEGAVAGVVHDPIRGETFTAVRGGPARLNGRVVSARTGSDLGMAMIATGFAYDAGLRAEQGKVFAGLIGEVRDVRRCGAAALDLAWTAAGRYDAYYERGLNAWDLAAGELLCRSAGLSVRELAATEAMPGGIMVAPPGLADQLEALVG